MPFQGGFTKNRRTMDNLYILNTIREGAKKRRRSLYCLFLDVAKAYDCVDRTKLAAILERNGFSRNLARAIMSSLDNTSYAVKMGGRASAIRRPFGVFSCC